MKHVLTVFGALFFLCPSLAIAQSSLGANKKAGKYVEVNDIKLYYETYGRGEPLLLFHGNGGSLSSFLKQIPVLSKHYKVIAIDSRAHGKSTDSDKELTFTLMASDMSELIRKLNLGPVYVVGQSDGGNIGLELALAHPEQVKKVVAMGANYTYANYAAKIEKMEMDKNDPFIKTMTARIKEALKTRPKATPLLKKKYEDLDNKYPNLTREQLKQIQTPFLIVNGDHDLISLEHTIDLYSGLPHAQLLIVPNASHIVLLEQPEVLNAAILKFFKTPYRDLDRDYFGKIRKQLLAK